MLKNSSIKARLVLLIGFLSIAMIGIGLLGLHSLGAVDASLKTVYEDRLVALGFLDKAARSDLRGRLGMAAAVDADPAHADSEVTKAGQMFADGDQAWSAYTATYLTPDEKKYADQFEAQRKRFLDEGVKPAMSALRAGDKVSGAKLVGITMRDLYASAIASLDALVQLQLDVAKVEYENSQATYETVRNIAIATIALGLLLGGLLGRWVIRSISAPLAEAIGLAGHIASGDLTRVITVESDNETGRLMQALKEMTASLVRIVTEVRAGTQAIATASGQIAAGNVDLSARTEQQAASLEETAASMSELTATVKQNLDNARQANTIGVSAVETVEKGSTAVEQLVATVNEISESSGKIAEIITLIEGIAFQTNILALNAAVEAARAGEQGRGFAVVASEVRSLAQRSSQAAKEIKGLIETSVQTVRGGVAEADAVGRNMVEVKQAIRRVADLVGEISAASEEQSRGIEQIDTAVSQMDEVTQQNAALVEEAAAASQSMDDQAGKLKVVAAVFKLPGGKESSSDAYTDSQLRRPAARALSRPAAFTSGKPRAAKSEAHTASISAEPRQAQANEAGWETF